MKNGKIVKEYAEQQYKTHQKLVNRMNLWSYGTNPESLPKWIFKKIQLQEYERVLELGCGTGQLWLENFKNVPSTCLIILSDFSKNMLTKARENLQLKLPLKFEIINAEEIPYPNQVFDVVIACHMLYHVPIIKKALTSISRVLKPDGRFIATTISYQHIQELKDFLSEFGLYPEEMMNFFSEFRNETGREVLNPFFEKVEFFEYINYLHVKSVDPLIRYIETLFPVEHYHKFEGMKSEIKNSLLTIIEKKSKFKIKGITGLFIAKKPKIYG